MSYLKKASKNHAYLKMGIYGDAGSGKSTTAALVAAGLHKYAKLSKPVAMFDTEPAASFLIPIFEKAKIEFLVYDQSRALDDLLGWAAEVEKECSIGIIDSITHVWRELQTTYLDDINAKRKKYGNKAPLSSLEFQHWGPIKEKFGRFTDWFLSSQAHVIVCGRQGGIYDYQKNETTGKLELVTRGHKMATEKEMGYEPSLLVSMEKVIDERGIINTAFVEKDRSACINGQQFQMPTFEHFIPHIKSLNLGGEQFGSMNDRKSSFDNFADGDYDHQKRQQEIWLEEIKELLNKYHPGRAAEEVKAKADALEKHFGTRAWAAVESLKPDILRQNYLSMRDAYEPDWRDVYEGQAKHILAAIGRQAA